MQTSDISNRLKKLPQKSGIYIFRSNRNKPLYIGKALDLKNRVKNYIRIADPRLQKMISEAKKLDYIETDSEIEALILESQYIKKYQPTFNIMLRDDKQYGFVEFIEEKFPKIFITQSSRSKASGKITLAPLRTLELSKPPSASCDGHSPIAPANNYIITTA